MGKIKKAVALFLGQTDTGTTERHLHTVEPKLWAMARRLEAELGTPPRKSPLHKSVV